MQSQNANTDARTDEKTPIDATELPDTWSWNHDSVQEISGDLTAIQATADPDAHGGRVSLGGDVRSIAVDTCAYVLDGLDDYLEQHAVRTLETPTYYSEIDHSEILEITEETTIGSDTGLTGEMLEKAIRFATGGGSYRSSDLTITITDSYLTVVEYGDHAYVYANQPVDHPGDHSAEAEVQGVTVRGEESDTVLEGLGLMFDTLRDVFGITIESFEKRSGKRFHFTTADGDTIHIKGTDAITLQKVEQDPDEIRGVHTFECGPVGREVSYTVDELEYGIGDQYSEQLDDYGRCIGYGMDRKSRYLRRQSTRRVTLSTLYYFLHVTEKSSRGSEWLSVSLSDYKRGHLQKDL